MQTFNERFLSFVRSKDPDEEYDYSWSNECAVGQFTKHLGIHDEYIKYRQDPLNKRNEFYQLERLAIRNPWTWGALAKRIEEEIAFVES